MSSGSARLMNGRRLEMRQSFDLEKGPLFKFRLARLESQYHLLIFTYHHSIVDGQSVGVFFKELKAYYSAECRAKSARCQSPGSSAITCKIPDGSVRKSQTMPTKRTG